MPSIRSALALLGASAVMAAPIAKRANDEYAQRAIKIYDVMTGNGSYNSEYFSPERVPYHSVETLMVEAPDYGHESVSETFSYWIWLEAINGKLTGDYSGVEKAWTYLEKHIIPTSKDQPGNSKYNPQSPATYAPEDDEITNYPAQLAFNQNVVGEDPIAKELAQAYGNWDIYIMHWIIDADNWYGYGQRGDGTSKPSYINTFQRGPSESVWKVITHPCWEAMNWGGRNGFLDLFTIDNSYAKQWRYTSAPDADSRAIQAAFMAYQWAKEEGTDLSSLASKAAKLGDYLRYAQYDKYFKKVGNCVGYNRCANGTGKSSNFYLISWYFAWGGGLQGDWAWRIGSSHTHSGYQNVFTAWILSTQPAFKPKGATAVEDWEKSRERQIELYRWLQAAEGCIAGGATNSWQGHYAQPGSQITSFYGMWYDWQPVYHDPPSNDWTGMQGWGMERTCAYYYHTGDEKAGIVCKKWSQWVKDNVRINGNELIHATNFKWSGNPDEWNPSNFNKSNLNASLHGSVKSSGIDIGSIASIVKGLLWTSMKDNDQEGIDLTIKVMDTIENYWDGLGYATEEAREDYKQFGNEVYVPSGWTGKNAQGAQIQSGVTFIDLRPKYKQDPDWAQVEDGVNGGPAPIFHYHRFWAQTEIAVANAMISIYDLKTDGDPSQKPGSCSSKITAQGYSCCAKNCKVTYTDADGDWGFENNQWCGCGGGEPEATCSAAIIAQGYKCCSDSCTVTYTDDAGTWGVENGQWCGCGASSVQPSTCSASITAQGYSCCSGCDVQYTDSDGKWGVENGQWCGIKSSC